MTTIDPTTIVSDSTLAALLGISTRRIRQLVESGDLTRAGRNEFALGPALRELVDHAAGQGSAGALVRERIRATKATADMRELEVATARGQVARIDEFERVQSARYALIRQNLLNVPTRAVLQLLGCLDEAEFKAKLRDEIVLALRTSAAARIDLEALEGAGLEENDGE